MRTFAANAVAASELVDANTLAVVLAERTDGSGARLEIQRALSFDAQDRRLGQATYCLCTEDGATRYGGVASWRLSGDTLEIALSAEAARVLDARDGFRVRLAAEPASSEVIRSALRRILVGALELPREERATLAQELLASVDGEDADASAAWADVIRRRVDDALAGRAKGPECRPFLKELTERLRRANEQALALPRGGACRHRVHERLV